MSAIAMDRNLYIGSFGMEQVSYDMVETSDSTGAEAVRLLGPPRWKVSMGAGDNMTLTQSGLWEAIVMKLKRGINCLAVFDPVRTLPQGTMRGTPTLAASAAAGAETITLSGGAGTLSVGDWAQLGTGPGTSQLVKVIAPYDGSAPLNFAPPLRIGFATGTPVTLDHPVFYARMINKSVRWDYQAGNMFVSGFALDLLETFQ